jgi:hypothetical protein
MKTFTAKYLIPRKGVNENHKTIRVELPIGCMYDYEVTFEDTPFQDEFEKWLKNKFGYTLETIPQPMGVTNTYTILANTESDIKRLRLPIIHEATCPKCGEPVEMDFGGTGVFLLSKDQYY